ncbi:MAG: flagellar hook basal-body protein [Polyangiaceae bacterium]
MSDGIYVALSGALAQATNLETTAENLANASTDGYQRSRPLFREELTRAGLREPGLAYTSVAGTPLDTARGPLRATGRALDFAMPQGTYLAVSTPRGERYTRAGSLAVGIDGTLRTAHGDTVINESGKPIQISGDANDLRVDDSGQVMQGTDVQGRVKLVTFAQPGNLTHDEGPLLSSNAASGAATPSQGPLEVGQIEQSNANVVNSMTDLVTASRNFDAFQRIIDTFQNEDRKVVTTVPNVQ